VKNTRWKREKNKGQVEKRRCAYALKNNQGTRNRRCAHVLKNNQGTQQHRKKTIPYEQILKL